MHPRRRPPADISLDQLFTCWLPAEIERLGSAAGSAAQPVRIEIHGPEAGSWDLCLSRGKLIVTAGDVAHQPMVTLRLSSDDWRALIVGEEGPVSLSPPASSATDLLFIDSHSQQLVSKVSGTFRFAIHHYNGRTWALSATLGCGPQSDPPDATIAMDATTYAAIVARKLSVAEAFWAKKIAISGDAARGMQVGLALLPKF